MATLEPPVPAEPGAPSRASEPGAQLRAQRGIDPVHVVDWLGYVVVLNLAAELVPSVISESFVVSLAVALALKLVLEVVLRAKGFVVGRLRAASTGAQRAVAVVALGLVLPGSKILVLELIGFLFPHQVSLGGFASVTGLILVLLLTRRGVRALLAPSSPIGPPSSAPPSSLAGQPSSASPAS